MPKLVQFGNDTVEFPDSMDNSAIEHVLSQQHATSQPKGFVHQMIEGLVGKGEAAVSAATAIPASIGASMTELALGQYGLSNQGDTPEKAQARMQALTSKFTYQPRTEEGRTMARSLETVVNMPGRLTGEGVRKFGPTALSAVPFVPDDKRNLYSEMAADVVEPVANFAVQAALLKRLGGKVEAPKAAQLPPMPEPPKPYSGPTPPIVSQSRMLPPGARYAGTPGGQTVDVSRMTPEQRFQFEQQTAWAGRPPEDLPTQPPPPVKPVAETTTPEAARVPTVDTVKQEKAMVGDAELKRRADNLLQAKTDSGGDVIQAFSDRPREAIASEVAARQTVEKKWSDFPKAAMPKLTESDILARLEQDNVKIKPIAEHREAITEIRKSFPAARNIFNEKGRTIDEVAMDYGYADGEALMESVQKAAQGRAVARARPSETQSHNAEMTQRIEFEKAAFKPAKSKTAVPVNQLEEGQSFTLKGEKFKVKEVDAEGNVIVEDGKKFGRQPLNDAQVIHAEEVTTPVAGTEFSTETPKEKIAMNPKTGQAEAFTGGDTLSLVGEKGIDFEKLQQTAADKAQYQKQAEAMQKSFDLSRQRPGEAGGIRIGPYADSLRERFRKLSEMLPMEPKISREVPNSPVISLTDRLGSHMSTALNEAVRMPWFKEIMKRDPAQLEKLESEAVEAWKALGKDPAALNTALANAPADVRQMFQFMKQLIDRDRVNRATLEMEGPSELPGPYMPRIALEDWESTVNLGESGNFGAHLQTTIKNFQKARTHETMMEGRKNGVDYEDARKSMLMRIWHSIKLDETARMVSDLEKQKVIYRTRDAAMKAGNRAIRIKNLPGNSGEDWWATTRPEAKFLEQNFKGVNNTFGKQVQLMNDVFRSPNLVNPLPHFTKNMLYKYGMSGGSMTRVTGDMVEFWRKSNPKMLAQFEKYMPYSKEVDSAQAVLDKYLNRGPLDRLRRVARMINRPSSKVIFQQLDPALRYSRFKQYLEEGMPPQEAANRVTVNLIRYSTRSDLVDGWKSIPGNFFVQWRLGTVQALLDNVKRRAIKTALFVGAVDTMREMLYRKTGWWLHLPIDYTEGPISQIIIDKGNVAPIAATTAAFGPGGEFSASNLRDILGVITGREDKKKLFKMFWGLSQVFNMPTAELEAWANDGDDTHLAKMFATFAIGAHPSLTYEPRRFGAILPEDLPGMGKSDKVARAEAMQAKAERLREKQTLGRERHELTEREMTAEDAQASKLRRMSGRHR